MHQLNVRECLTILVVLGSFSAFVGCEDVSVDDGCSPSCDADHVCVNKICVVIGDTGSTHECIEGETKCSNNAFYACNKDHVWSAAVQCTSEQFCTQDGCKAIDITAVNNCVCNDDRVLECNHQVVMNGSDKVFCPTVDKLKKCDIKDVISKCNEDVLEFYCKSFSGDSFIGSSKCSYQCETQGNASDSKVAACVNVASQADCPFTEVCDSASQKKYKCDPETKVIEESGTCSSPSNDNACGDDFSGCTTSNEKVICEDHKLTITGCTEGKTCVAGDCIAPCADGSCDVSDPCDEGESVCLDEKTLLACKSGKWAKETKDDDHVCVNGKWLDVQCENGDYQCVGNMLQQCNHRRWVNVMNCAIEDNLLCDSRYGVPLCVVNDICKITELRANSDKYIYECKDGVYRYGLSSIYLNGASVNSVYNKQRTDTYPYSYCYGDNAKPNLHIQWNSTLCVDNNLKQCIYEDIFSSKWYEWYTVEKCQFDCVDVKIKDLKYSFWGTNYINNYYIAKCIDAKVGFFCDYSQIRFRDVSMHDYLIADCGTVARTCAMDGDVPRCMTKE